ncbi:CC0125/CC1285 family lipoprotein [Sphingomonas sp. RS2018]
MRRKAVFAAALAGATLLSACVGPTPYRPAVGNGFNRDGFSDQQIERDRFAVTFAGNSYTSRERVERYLLFRAAELTLSRGYDHFILANRDLDKQQRTYTTPGFGGGWGGFSSFGYWGPSWRYYGRGFGWRGWDPFFGDPFWDRGVDVRTVERYEASAEIIVGRGPKPAGNVRAFDARDVVDRLGPSIQLPEDRRR